MKTLGLFCLLLLLAACSTFGDIHKSEPVKTLSIVDKSPEVLANCSLFEAKSRGFNAVLTQRQNEFILFLSRIYINDMPFGEITFKPQDKGTLIEIRAYSGYGVRESWALDCVIPCASQNSSSKTKN